MIEGIDFVELEAEEYWSTTKEKTKKMAHDMVFSGDYIGSRKVDGHHYRFIKDGDILRLQGRSKGVSGEYLSKIDHVPHIKKILNTLPDGTVLVGELFFPDKEHSKNVTTIMGCLKEKAIARQTKGNELHYYIFDILAWDGKSLINKSLDERIDILNGMLRKHLELVDPNKFTHIATYYEKEKLWDYIAWALTHDYEGVVIQNRYDSYAPGKRTARKTLKIKKEITVNIDAYLTGYYKLGTKEYTGKEPECWKFWVNTRTNERLYGEHNYDEYIISGIVIPVTKDWFYELPASIEFAVMGHSDEDIHLCWVSNITDALKQEIKDSPTNCRGKVAVITAMEIDKESGKLRHSKISEWRDDISYQDCTFSKIPI